MDFFRYRDRVLHCEDVPLRKLAESYGTPLYVYSRATLLHHLKSIQSAFAGAVREQVLDRGADGYLVKGTPLRTIVAYLEERLDS